MEISLVHENRANYHSVFTFPIKLLQSPIFPEFLLALLHSVEDTAREELLHHARSVLLGDLQVIRRQLDSFTQRFVETSF